MRIFWGFTIVIVGILITLYADWINRNFGAMSFAEKWLGAEGGSRLFYRLIGMLATFVGFLMITGLLGKLILWIFLPLFTGFQLKAPTP